MKERDFDGLLAFRAVAERGSFAAAATSLEVSASAVSQRVRLIEERLETRLFSRTTRAVHLTEAGAQLLAKVSTALEEIEAALEDTRMARGQASGLLRLNMPALVARRILAPHLAEFSASYPGVTLEIFVEDGLTDVVAGGFDAGIRLGEMLAQDMVCLPLGGSLRAAVVASPDYLARHPAPESLEALSDHACIRYRQISRGTVYRWEFLRDGQEVSVDVGGSLIVNDSQLMLQAAQDGLGLAWVLELEAAPYLQSGALVRVLEPYCAPFPGLYLYYPSRSRMPPKLKAFITFLRAARLDAALKA